LLGLQFLLNCPSQLRLYIFSGKDVSAGIRRGHIVHIGCPCGPSQGHGRLEITPKNPRHRTSLSPGSDRDSGCLIIPSSVQYRQAIRTRRRAILFAGGGVQGGELHFFLAKKKGVPHLEKNIPGTCRCSIYGRLSGLSISFDGETRFHPHDRLHRATALA
jgi:hypothetical protein